MQTYRERVEELSVSRPARTHEVRVDGLSLTCRLYGRGPLCVVHPGGPGAHWEYLRIPLAERELTMAYLEPAGTGASGSPRPGAAYDLTTYVRHLHAVIEHVGADPVFVLGHGHGGAVAQGYALAHPGRLAGLVLYATGPAAGAATAAAIRDRLRDYAVDNSYTPALASWDRPAGPGEAEATRRERDLFPAYFADYWRREAEFAPVRDGARAWPAPAAAFDVRSALPSITAPTLVLAGARDLFFPSGAAGELHDGIPGSRLATFQHSGHFAHLEESERFAHLLLEFTRRVTGPYRVQRR
ncbi:Pimeloyl-ACP methyl ester carboxylesterase [Paractinoplanes atraurantiacus]|uniref:Pimeloyl-ACP methyl ester carboxylesterase n=1 Tax=Paractinoplanes atraurantiacus TaxID=1036182 RepID=A0A285GRI3_9ACTN|nr:Pimeloyl-ACP methyl ester carboxylesterase [Actinoplanes atraurantiacus]